MRDGDIRSSFFWGAKKTVQSALYFFDLRPLHAPKSNLLMNSTEYKGYNLSPPPLSTFD